jgi:KUP system potassium uptake protein
VFLSRGNKTAPLALRANVEHNDVLHEHLVIVTFNTLPTPLVGDAERIEIEPAWPNQRRNHPRDRTFRIHGNAFDVRHALRLLAPTKTEGSIAIDDASYFLSKIELTKGEAPTMPRGVRISSLPRPS